MTDNTPRSCCFTGHRIIRKQDSGGIYDAIKNEIRNLSERGISNFISGGALGFDMLAAEAVLELRDGELPFITLELMLPCENQAIKWRESERVRYAGIISRADKVGYTSREYTPTCMAERNRAMVDASEHCIAYMYKSFGGTAYTVRYVNDTDKGLTLI